MCQIEYTQQEESHTRRRQMVAKHLLSNPQVYAQKLVADNDAARRYAHHVGAVKNFLIATCTARARVSQRESSTECRSLLMNSNAAMTCHCQSHLRRKEQKLQLKVTQVQHKQVIMTQTRAVRRSPCNLRKCHYNCKWKKTFQKR